MSNIELTERVRTLLSPAAARLVVAFVEATITRVALSDIPVSNWHISTASNTLNTGDLLEYADGEGLPKFCWVDLICQLPADAILSSDIPEEHTLLALHDGKLWTAGDLAMRDQKTLRNLDAALGPAAVLRVYERLRLENLEGWRTWPCWADDTDHGHQDDDASSIKESDTSTGTTRVYGSATVEPGGFYLDNETWTVPCDKCGKDGQQRSWEELEGGSIERYHRFMCKHCGHFETDWSEP